MKKKICNRPGCNELIDITERYCLKHTENATSNKPFENAKRSNGGFYNTCRWRMLRKQHLKENPYCVKCGNRDSLTVDHVVPPRGNEDLFFDLDNLQTLCETCHRAKTSMEIRKRRQC
jgi:5-methylcytosine-specific restriction protein A